MNSQAAYTRTETSGATPDSLFVNVHDPAIEGGAGKRDPDSSDLHGAVRMARLVEFLRQSNEGPIAEVT